MLSVDRRLVPSTTARTTGWQWTYANDKLLDQYKTEENLLKVAIISTHRNGIELTVVNSADIIQSARWATRTATVWTPSGTSRAAATIPFLARARGAFPISIRLFHLFTQHRKNRQIIKTITSCYCLIQKKQPRQCSRYRKHCSEKHAYEINNSPE